MIRQDDRDDFREKIKIASKDLHRSNLAKTKNCLGNINDFIFKFRNIIIKFGGFNSNLDIFICKKKTEKSDFQLDPFYQRKPAETKT